MKRIDELQRQLMYNKVTFLHCITWRNVNEKVHNEKRNRVMMIRDYQLSQLASVSPASLYPGFLFASNAIKLMQLFTIFEPGSSNIVVMFSQICFSSGALVELRMSKAVTSGRWSRGMSHSIYTSIRNHHFTLWNWVMIHLERAFFTQLSR